MKYVVRTDVSVVLRWEVVRYEITGLIGWRGLSTVIQTNIGNLYLSS